MAFLDKHKKIETNAFLLMVLSLIVVAVVAEVSASGGGSRTAGVSPLTSPV